MLSLGGCDKLYFRCHRCSLFNLWGTCCFPVYLMHIVMSLSVEVSVGSREGTCAVGNSDPTRRVHLEHGSQFRCKQRRSHATVVDRSWSARTMVVTSAARINVPKEGIVNEPGEELITSVMLAEGYTSFSMSERSS